MSYLAPLTTFALETADHSASDLRAEYQRYLLRQKAIVACLMGTESPAYLLDMLAEHGFDVCEYVSDAVANIEETIASNDDFEASELDPFLQL